MSGVFTAFEQGLKALSAVLSVPLAPFAMLSVRQNCRGVYVRFGKVDRIMEPGLRWAPLGGYWKSVFVGSQTHTFKDLRIVDSNGTPITVTAILQYNVEDPEKYIMKANGNLEVLEREAQVAIRSICSQHPYDSSDGSKNLRKNSQDMSHPLYEAVKAPLLKYGFEVEAVNIIEANYAPEVMQQMLMKQQAKAYVEARKEIVEGAIGVAKETIAKFPEMSKSSQEAIISNLLTTLTSGATPQATIPLR